MHNGYSIKMCNRCHRPIIDPETHKCRLVDLIKKKVYEVRGCAYFGLSPTNVSKR